MSVNTSSSSANGVPGMDGLAEAHGGHAPGAEKRNEVLIEMNEIEVGPKQCKKEVAVARRDKNSLSNQIRNFFSKNYRRNSSGAAGAQPLGAVELLCDELLILIQTYLDPPSIGRMSQVSHRFYRLSFDVQLWRISISNWEEKSKKNIFNLAQKTIKKYNNYPFQNRNLDPELIKSPTMIPQIQTSPQFQASNSIPIEYCPSSGSSSSPYPGNIPSLQLAHSNDCLGNPRSFYIETFIRYRNLNRDRIEDIKTRREVLERDKHISRSTKFMYYSFLSRPYEWISVMSIIVFTVFLTIKLDNIVHWSWPIIFSPLLLLFPIILGPIFFDLFRTFYNYNYENEFSPNIISNPLFFSLLFIMPLKTGIPFYRFLVFTPIFSIASFIILLIFKLTFPLAFSLFIVFIPLFVLSVYLILFSLTFPERIDYSSSWLDQMALCACTILLSLFFAVLYCKIDGLVNIPWAIIFSPLFVIKFIILFYVVLINLLYYFGCHHLLEHKSEWFREEITFTFVIVAWFLVLAPLLCFEIILVRYLETLVFYQFYYILIPLYFIELLTILGCILVNYAFIGLN